MATIALVLLACWTVAMLVSRRRAASGHSGAGKWNAGLLLVVLAMSIATCVAPVAPLLSGLDDVANAAPAEDSAVVLQQLIARARTPMALALLAIPLIALGVLQHARNRRRIAESKRVRDAS